MISSSSGSNSNRGYVFPKVHGLDSQFLLVESVRVNASQSIFLQGSSEDIRHSHAIIACPLETI